MDHRLSSIEGDEKRYYLDLFKSDLHHGGAYIKAHFPQLSTIKKSHLSSDFSEEGVTIADKSPRL